MDFECSNTLLYLDPVLFLEPEIREFSGIDVPIYCFLISHEDQHVVFDLGVRQDWQNYAPKIVSLIKATTRVTPVSDVASILDSDNSGLNIRSQDINCIIWSHNHFDHIGDPSTFPPSTQLVVGPGVRAASWPGWPSNPDAGTLESDADGREVLEISFDTGLKVGRFDAHDFFGDGSLYLLDAPGHATGHMCALARTTSNPDSFVFMGADACHHPGVLRPTAFLPLPQFVMPSSPMYNNTNSDSRPETSNSAMSAYPDTLFHQLIIGRSPGTPFFTVAKTPLFPDHGAAMDTISKIQELDAADTVFVIISHDLSLHDKIPLFPETINAWKANDLRVQTRWLFCNDFKTAQQCRNLGL